MPETARVTGVPSASRMAAAVTRSISGLAPGLDRADLLRLLSGGPEQGVDQMVAGIGQDAASGHLGVESPAAFLRGQRARPGPGENGRHHSHRADFAGGEPAPGFDQAGAKAKLMPDPDLEAAPLRQAHDVGRLLHIGGERLLDEHMATGLEGIHGQSVVREMRREDRQCVGRLLRQKLTMVGEGRNAARARPAAPSRTDARSARPRAA